MHSKYVVTAALPLALMSNTKALLLINLGSPDSTSVADVKKYLTEFLMDKRVINAPWLFRSLLVKGLIVPFRSPKSAEAYSKVWWAEGSPLVSLTCQLQKAVAEKTGLPVEIAMRYGNPSPKAAYDKLLKLNPALEEVIIFPLYPHYAMSSYETAVEYMYEVYKKFNYIFKLKVVKPFYNNEAYLHAQAEVIRPFVQDDNFDKILFSYHGLPERHIRISDCTGKHCLKVNDCCHVPSAAHAFCYRHQTVYTTEKIVEILQIPQHKVEQTFQSRLGRDKWLTPMTAQRLTQLPKEGIKKLLVVCPAFVSDCLETLEEIAIQGKKSFLESGGEEYNAIPCMNVAAVWTDALLHILEESEQQVTV